MTEMHCRCERRDEESARELARLPRYGDELQALTVGHHELRLVKVVNDYWERVFGGVVIICVPRDCGYDPLEALSRDLAPSQD